MPLGEALPGNGLGGKSLAIKHGQMALRSSFQRVTALRQCNNPEN